MVDKKKADRKKRSEPLRSFQQTNFGVPKKKHNQAIQDAALAHVESFDYLLNEGLGHMVEDVHPLEIEFPNGDRIKIKVSDCKIEMPCVKRGVTTKTFKVYPAECRSRGVTYKGSFPITAAWYVNGQLEEKVEKSIGEIPIMVKSKACNLRNLNPLQTVSVGEDENEFGGYFIINGLERVVRMLIIQRRNYPIAMQRNGWRKKGDLFTEYGVSIRCVRADQSGSNLVLHYLSDGTVKIMFTFKKEVYFIPVMIILKALLNECDSYIYECLIKGKAQDTFYKRCISNMLRQSSQDGLYFHNEALKYIGEKFGVRMGLPSWYTEQEVASFLLKKCICIHLNNNREKFDLLVFMIQKLFAVVKNECVLESPDNPTNQEILLPGHLYLCVIKEKLYSWLGSLRMAIERKLKSGKTLTVTKAFIRDCMKQSMDISQPIQNFLATGNFIPRFEGSLLQNSGLCIVGDKLNFWRYLSHFRSVHRGAFFAEMRTTTVRKLLPEAWGFLCPVHTPDGTPCGLLNHISSMCKIVNVQHDTSHLYNVFCKHGMVPYDDPVSSTSKGYTVFLDGKVVGWILNTLANRFVHALRILKVLNQEKVPDTMEICFFPKTEHASLFPGIFIFTTPARMMRPVKNLQSNKIEFIGSMEQVHLHIALDSKSIIAGETNHQEIAPTNVLSMLANQIPYSDFNQSPRNMYECQMGKQTMGTPCHAFRYRSDNKLYHLRTPQAPIVRPKLHDFYQMDDYPLGTNAIVAVVSYTGFDMEDAIILNKSSVERGFKHGSIYKSELINLRVFAGDKGLQKTLHFGRKHDNYELAPFIDIDGLPYIGTRLGYGDPICSYIDPVTQETSFQKYKSVEEAYVQDVKVLGNDSGTDTNQQIYITYRIPRNPLIGDKFASRHGQKGICSLLLPAESMPFTECGMTPDIIFNPHGFPSRMTIGMMIESMAGKAASMNGSFPDATPFQFSEDKTAVEYFGNCLKDLGFDYYGTERMYSGVDGRELEADIFFGVIYYQRLRHMVSDKYQVRTTGPVEPLTRQPVKGRKREGGIRFGEMERDSLIAHGSSFLLHDRLFSCSDGCQQYVCVKCENITSPIFESTKSQIENNPEYTMERNEWTCRMCGSSKDIFRIDIPFVFRYLCEELAAMNIRIQLKVDDYA